MAEYSVVLGVISIVIVLTLGVLAGTVSDYLLQIVEDLAP
jgi:Flp pilus assembly pilin Flp